MKRFVPMAFAVLMIVGLSACKKEYTCVCDIGSGQTTSVSAKFAKQSEAEAWCEDNSSGLCELQ